MELDAILATLLVWASQLSGYPVPEELPDVRFESHAFFVENVCFGQECKVVGWYDDAGTIFIDERYREVDDQFAKSLLVHEFTHFLQHANGAFQPPSCNLNIAREKEAYEIQNRYIAVGLTGLAPIRPPTITCDYPNAGHAGKDVSD